MPCTSNSSAERTEATTEEETMKSLTRHLGLRFRMRHLFILVTYFAVLLGILVPVLKLYGSSFPINAKLLILLASPWLLGVLVLLVERKGPVKYWAAPLLLSLTAPALAICHDWVIADVWHRTGAIPNAMVSLLLNIVLIGSFSAFFISMYPGCCPKCGHRSLIPLLRLWGRGNRTSQTRWCGVCGAKYWRNREGLWQKERRATWVDALTKDSPAASSGDGSPRDAATPALEGTARPLLAPRGRKRRRSTASAGSSVKSD